MKNTSIIPHVRNRYFYGKLLTVRDFETEQQYFNDKRRLLNRLLFGSGVIAGLQVVAVDDKSITVEMGVGLDSLGREIVVPSPVTHRLSTIQGFDNNEYAKNVYLCIAYDEKAKEAVHSVSNSEIEEEERSEHTRWLESYRLFIKEEAPSFEQFDIQELIWNHQMIVNQDQLRVWMKSPRYVEAGDSVEVQFFYEKQLQMEEISFTAQLQVEGGELLDMEKPVLTFKEKENSHKTIFSQRVRIKTKRNLQTNVKLQLEKAQLRVGDRNIALPSSLVQEIERTDEPIRDKIIKNYYERSLNQAIYSEEEAYLCIAKVSLMKINSTYIIEQVEPVPFHEYVYNTSLVHHLHHKVKHATQALETESAWIEEGSKPILEHTYLEDSDRHHLYLGIPKPPSVKHQVARGTIDIPLEEVEYQRTTLFKSHKHYVSKEIDHGLGKGPVYVQIGMTQLIPMERENPQLNHVYFGNVDVFKGSEWEIDHAQVSTGVVTHIDKGTFQIGVKVTSTLYGMKVRVHWWAVQSDLVEGLQTENRENITLYGEESNKSTEHSPYSQAAASIEKEDKDK